MLVDKVSIFYLNTKFGNSSVSYSRDRIVGVKNENGSCDPAHAPFNGDLFIYMLGLDIAYLCTQFDHCSFSHSKDMVGASQKCK